MPHMKKILTSALAAALTLSMCSCQLSHILPGKEEESTTTGEQTTFTLSDTATSTTEPVDLMNADLSAYVTLGNYKGLTADETVTPLTDDEFETELTSYLNSIAIYEKITDRPTAQGDTIVMDYVGTIDGVAFSGGTAQGQTIELSENSGYIDGFAEGLVGVTPGSTVDLNLTFPEDYHSADVAGKAAVFTVTVQHIQGELIPPEATDAFITRFTDGEYTSLEAFRTYYRAYLEEQAKQTAHENAVTDLWSQTVELSTFHTIPQQQIDHYTEQMRAQYEYYAQMYGVTYETILSLFGLSEETVLSQAQEYAKQDLVFYSLVQAEGLTVTDAEYTEGLAEYAADAGVTAQELEDYYGKEYLVETLLWNKMLDMLYSYANITK